MRFLLDAIRQHARDQPDRLALADDRGTHIPYGALPIIIDSIALHSLDAGVEPGQTVVVATPARSNFGLLIALGMLRAGVTVAIAPRDHLERAGIVPDAVLMLRAPDNPGSDKIIAVGADWMTHPHAQSATNRLSTIPDPGPVAVMFSSSGTTGRNKIIPMGVEAVKIKVIEKELPKHATKSKLNMFSPLSPMGLSIDYCAFYHGKTILRIGKGTHKYMNIFSDKRVDSVYAAPYDLGKLVEFAEKYDLYALEHIKYVHTGGSMLSRLTLEKATTRLSRHVYVSYGATEVSRITISDLKDIPDIPGAVGKIEARATVDIVDEAGAVLPRNQEGRVRIYVPVEHRALGYIWSDNEITPFPDQYFMPGDIGLVTDDNILVIRGRETEIANYGGNKIMLNDIESLFLFYPYISDAAAVSNENPHGFDDILVAVVPKENADFSLDQLRSFIKAQRTDWKVKHIVVRDSIPRNEMGKIDRAVLKDVVLPLGVTSET